MFKMKSETTLRVLENAGIKLQWGVIVFFFNVQPQKLHQTLFQIV